VPFVIPTGRLSQIKHDAEEYQLQTEFSLEPEPRVTTTIVRGGQILKRINTPWGSGVKTEGDQRAVEGALRRQHDSLLLELKHVLHKRDTGELAPAVEAADAVSGTEAAEKVEEVSAQSVAASPTDVFGPVRRARAAAPVVVPPEVVTGVDAVRAMAEVESVFDVHPGASFDHLSDADAAWAETVRGISKWGNRVAQLSRLGVLESCLGEFADSNLLVFEREGRTIGVLPKPNTDLRKVVQSVRDVLEVA
jgi:hypothetical protein